MILGASGVRLIQCGICSAMAYVQKATPYVTVIRIRIHSAP
jgi:hypothetical protein